MRRFVFIPVALLALVLAGTALLGAQHTTLLKGPYPLSDTPAEFKPAVARAQEAFGEFQHRMDARLKEETARGGLQAALAVYRDEATAITADLGRRYNGRFGRTSDRLRDPRNAAPPWAADLVRQADTHATKDVTTWIVPMGTNVGVLAPLDTNPDCVLCHGPLSSIPTPTAATIRVTYPGDRATGYEIGQLRGWIWAELKRR